MRFVGERKACAAIVLAFFGLLFLGNGLAGPPGSAPMFIALAVAYFTGFAGVVAGWFWARWYTLGLSGSGLLMGATLLYRVGAEPAVIVWVAAHGALGIMLLGHGPSAAFDGRRDWRDRWHMDERAATRLGKAIMRAGASLPYLIMAGLSPRAGELAAPVALALVVAGLGALIRMRTFGLFLLAGAAALVLGGRPVGVGTGAVAALLGTHPGPSWPCPGIVAGLFLVTAILPFVAPIVRALRPPRDRSW